MKKQVRSFISASAALSQLSQFILSEEQIQRGRPLANFEQPRPRELVANWLIAAVLNYEAGGEIYRFTSDSDCDGIIYDTQSELDYPTEHVIVPAAQPGDTASIETLIRQQVQAKQDKGGTQYARGKMLVVFVARGGDVLWQPNAATRALPANDFANVWAVGLHTKGGRFTYGVTRLDSEARNVPVWLVDIAEDFAAWSVRRIQFPNVITARWDFGTESELRTGYWV
jgi:murein L,D-transpeptidase YcbB/YkuD